MIHEYELEKIWKNNLNEFASIMRLDSIIIRAMKAACIEHEKQINLSLGNVSNTEGKVCITCKKTLTYSEAEGGNCCDVCWLST